jgi:phosphatidyl-myo-inositol alpha-mannosyltransferase
MRVAIVSPYDLDVAGGVQSHVVSLAAALRDVGDEVWLVGPGTAAEGRVTVGGSIRVPANGSQAPLALSPLVVARVRTALRRIRPDVVHVHEPLVPLVGPAASTTRATPVVLTFHAYAEAGSLARLYRTVRPFGRRIVKDAAAVTAVSAVAADFHARALGIDVDTIRVVPNGVDVTRFTRPVPGGEPRPRQRTLPTVLFIGRFEHRKGVDVAVRAFGLLAAERSDVQLHLVGDGPLAGEVARLVAALPDAVRRRIVRSGRVSNADLPAVLFDADVLIVPSRGGESFGIVLLEAMAAGTPLVASDLAGYRAVARDGLEALLVPPGDPARLAAAAARMLDDPALREQLVSNGRVRAAGYDWTAVAARMRAVYGEALASSCRRTGRGSRSR